MTLLQRTRDADALNELVNHPDIRPHVGGEPDERLDLTGAVIDRNVFWTGAHGGFAMTWSAPGVYEVHTFILPEGRGEWAITAAREVLSRMRDEHGAEKVWTRVKPEARHTRLFTRAAGMRAAGSDQFDIGCGPEPFNIYEWRG